MSSAFSRVSHRHFPRALRSHLPKKMMSSTWHAGWSDTCCMFLRCTMFGMSLTLTHTGGTFSCTLFVVCLASVWLSLALGQRAQVPAFMAALLDAIRHTWLPRFLSWFRNSFFSKLDQSCPVQLPHGNAFVRTFVDRSGRQQQMVMCASSPRQVCDGCPGRASDRVRALVIFAW